MRKYKNVHTGNIKTKTEWVRQFEESWENGDLEPVDLFDLFVENGDLMEV